MTPISYLDVHRARKERKAIKSIQSKIKKENYIIRVTDKSSIFHLGHVNDYERKAEAYRVVYSMISVRKNIFLHGNLIK